nr:unnamed protein product [Callosobruchus analis]
MRLVYWQQKAQDMHFDNDAST